MQLSSYGCTQEVAKHERSVRVARGKLHDLHEVKSTINCAKMFIQKSEKATHQNLDQGKIIVSQAKKQFQTAQLTKISS